MCLFISLFKGIVYKLRHIIICMTYQEDGHEIQGEKILEDRVTAIKNIPKSYEMRMRGYIWKQSSNEWEINRPAFAGSDYISQTTLMISSYCEGPNLITKKGPEKFLRQFSDAFFRMLTMAVNDITVKQEDMRSIVKVFKDIMDNIGDIIVDENSRDIVKGIIAFKEKTEGLNEFN